MPNTHSDKPLRRLYFGDNLDIMGEAIPDAFVDLVYLDPPFNSDEAYNVFFETADLDPDEAQWTAFKDTWIWDEAADTKTTSAVSRRATLIRPRAVVAEELDEFIWLWASR